MPTWLLESLWRASWQAAVLAMVVLVVVRVLRGSITPQWRVVLLSLPLLRLACIVLPSSAFSVYPLLESNSTRLLPASATSSVTSSTTYLAPSTEVPIGVASSASNRQVKVNAVETRLLATDSGFRSMRWSWQGVVVAVWGMGFGASLICWLVAYLRIRRLTSQLKDVRGAYASHLVKRCRQLRLRRAVRLLSSDDVTGPATWGLLRPVVLIPATLLKSLPGNSIRTTIEHELQHIRRWDACWLIFARCVRCVQWFNPLAYLLCNRFRQAIELATDADTLSALGNSQRRAYGELLIRLAESRVDRRGWAQIASRHSLLKTRIEAITHPTPATTMRTLVAVSLLVGLSVTMLSEAAQRRDAIETESRAPESREIAIGVVVDAQGQPVVDAIVGVDEGELNDKRFNQTKTQSDGRFKLAYSDHASTPVQFLWVYSPQHTLVAVPLGERKNHQIVLPAPETIEYQVISPEKLPLKNATLQPHSIRRKGYYARLIEIPANIRELLEVPGDEEGQFQLKGLDADAIYSVAIRHEVFGEQHFQASYSKLQLLPAREVRVRLRGPEGDILRGPQVLVRTTLNSQQFDFFIPPSTCEAEAVSGDDGVYRATVGIGQIRGRIHVNVLVANSEINQPLPLRWDLVESMLDGSITDIPGSIIDIPFGKTVEVRGVAEGVDGRSLSRVLLNFDRVTLRTDDHGNFVGRLFPGQLQIESAEFPRHLQQQYGTTPLDANPINVVEDTAGIRIVFPERQRVKGRIVGLEGAPPGQERYVSGYLRPEFGIDVLGGIVDDKGNFDAVLYQDEGVSLSDCHYYLSDKPIDMNDPASSEQTISKLKLVNTGPLVLQLVE